MRIKRILIISDYIFYRVYTFFLSTSLIKGNNEEKAVSAISALIIFTFVPITIISVVPLFYIFNIHLTRYSKTYISLFLILFILSRPIHKRYMNPKISKNNYQLFRERWGNEEPTRRKIRGRIIIALFVNNIILIPIIAVIIKHYFLL